jgi:hypothetical protein
VGVGGRELFIMIDVGLWRLNQLHEKGMFISRYNDGRNEGWDQQLFLRSLTSNKSRCTQLKSAFDCEYMEKSVEGAAYSSWLCEGAFPPGNRKTGLKNGNDKNKH